MFALVDCNNFYASCERLFRPELRGKPIIVLSNNDGCVVARSDEAKACGVEMGIPLHEITELVKRRSIQVFSSNYALYGDLSARVTTVLRQLSPSLEVYSIDESFCDVSGINDPKGWALGLRDAVWRKVGIPVCVGMARTKTLAKVANRIAKKFKAKTAGVQLLDSPEAERKALRWLPVGDVWGIGWALERKLGGYGIKSAADFADRPEGWVRQKFGVVPTRTWLELNGTSCIELCQIEPPRKTLRTSRSFERCLTERAAVESAVATFASLTAGKLRERGLIATSLLVSLQTNSFRKSDPQYSGARFGALTVPTSNTLEIVNFALQLLSDAWADGYAYKKAGVEALELVPEGVVQGNLFDRTDRQKLERLQTSLDDIAKKWGKDALQLAVQRSPGAWALRREHLSPRYTTCWSELLEVDVDACYRPAVATSVTGPALAATTPSAARRQAQERHCHWLEPARAGGQRKL
jgi:DNA polymerase V